MPKLQWGSSRRTVPAPSPRRWLGCSDLLAAKGIELFAVIDHSGEVKARGLELRDTKVVIFGSPEAGTPVMVSAPLVALELPLKVLVWADGDRTKVSYTAPTALAARYHLDDELASRLGAIEGLTDALVAPQAKVTPAP